MYPVPIPRNLVLLIPKINEAQNEYRQENKEEPDVEWLSERTGIPQLTVTELLALKNPFRLNKNDEDDDSHRSNSEVIGFTSEDEGSSKAQLSEMIMYLFSTISERDREIVKMHYGFCGRPYTLEEIGKEVGLSVEGVRQVIKKALKKFKGDPNCGGFCA
ncbi:MAG: hypothetical protein HUK12_10875 [Muribaculaceae bacterium]|nr:hypothetical protein [Muribaculaceae bacterium]